MRENRHSGVLFLYKKEYIWKGIKMRIEFKEISKSFGGVHALKKASLSVESEEIRALLGGNGSGKSTLIKIASGLVQKDSGEIYINGEKMSIRTPKDAKRLKIAATSQELSIFPNLTISENITLCAMPRKKYGAADRKLMRKKTLDVLRKLGLEEKIDMPVKELPVNEQYLIEFGKAIYQDFDILMVDEVTSALYQKDVETVKHILEEYKKQGKVILFVSHRLKELYQICDSVTIMRNGEVIETDRIADVDDDHLLSVMIGQSVQKIQENSVHGQAFSPDENTEKPYFVIENLHIGQYNTDLSLEIKKGEIIGVAGLQGHGQSELVRRLHGMDGTIKIKKGTEEIIIRNPRDAVKNKFAFISGDREWEGAFGQHGLTENISVVKELTLREKDTKPEQVLEAMHVKYARPGQLITSLSGGNQQKVIIGRWTYTKPVLLLADDPSKGIDVQARREMHTVFHRLAEEGTSMIIVSSDDDELVDLCSGYPNARVIVLYEGQISAVLRGNEITRDHIIEKTLSKGSEGK